jgi:alcohol dehydrogenase (cytochrome c)
MQQMRRFFLVLLPFTIALLAQTKNFKPVTAEMLKKPSPNDWLMFSRTYDAQRYSPLNQINTKNVGKLQEVWVHSMGSTGNTESIPIVHDGVIYVAAPGATVQALDGTNGQILWEYKRPGDVGATRVKSIAIYEDVVLYTAPDGFVVGLDARTGERRWETYAGKAAQTSGAIVANGKVISGRACAQTRDSCFIAAHDALTGKELWKFYTVPAKGEPGYETWGNPSDATHEKNMASTWGLPGSYDPVRNLVYWGVANPMPNTRAARHDGNIEAIGREAPADLYSNSTLALNPDTGKLVWYYQHLPGDDWDEDFTNERILTRLKLNPDPKFVKWINPKIKKGEERDVTVMMGEGGGIFVNDRATGEFLWATPFPFDTPRFLISNIDVKTGRTQINWDLVLKEPGENHLICFFNTTSYWPSSFHPGEKSVYIPYVDNCLDMTRATPAVGDEKGKGERRTGKQRPEGKPEEFAGIAKVNLETGEVIRFDVGSLPSTGGTLSTAGGLVFHGELDQRFHAFDAKTGKMLWETKLDGPVSVSVITYGVNGKQYVAVTTGDNLNTSLGRAANPPRGKNAIHVFALP